MAEFERAKEQIEGHGVTVTSWFDSSKGTWLASAPGHIHMLHRRSRDADAWSGGTRQQAIKRVVDAIRESYKGI